MELKEIHVNELHETSEEKERKKEQQMIVMSLLIFCIIIDGELDSKERTMSPKYSTSL